MQQAEQLWNASEVVDPSASPLLLFYGLAQAGRALLAAGAPINSCPRNGHGLQVDFSGGAIDFTRIHVKSHGFGLIQAVAEMLNSPVLHVSVTLAELLAAVGATSVRRPGAPTPLLVWNDWKGSNVHDRIPPKLIVGYVPDAWIAESQNTHVESGIVYSDAPKDPTVESIMGWLAPYPSLTRLGPPITASMHPHISTRIPVGSGYSRYYVTLAWDKPLLNLHESWKWASSLLAIDHSHIGKVGWGTVIPVVGGNDKAQNPLIGWWTVIFAFSIIARYYPREWMQILDVDGSIMATEIEALLDEARAIIPDLLSRALGSALGAGVRATRGYMDLSTYGPVAPDLWDAE